MAELAASDRLRRRLHAAGLALLVTGLITGCEASQPPAPTTSTPPSPTTSNGASLDFTGNDPEFPRSAQEYAELTVAAWAAPDLFRLAELASPQVQQEILDLPGPPDLTWRFLECQPIDGGFDCGFHNRDGDQLLVTISEDLLGLARAATGVEFQAIRFPQQALAYVAEFLTAWQVGNQARMAGLASPDAVAVFSARSPTTPADYRVTDSGGEQIRVLVTVDDEDLTLIVAPDRLGGPQAIRSAAG